MKVLSVVGTRAQLVKSFVVWRHLRANHDHSLVYTGEGVDDGVTSPVIEQLCLPEPEYDLSIGRPTPGRRTGRLLTFLEEIIAHEEPDVVVVYGDSATTLAGALAGSMGDPLVARIEAGVRGEAADQLTSITRVQADHAADLLFAPCERAAQQLRSEGIEEGVYVSGDVTVDAVRGVREHARKQSSGLEQLDLDPGEYVLATVRRHRNTADGRRLSEILRGLSSSPQPVVLPAHPVTADQIRRHGLEDEIGDDVRVLNPLGYLDFVALLSEADRVVTDSGVVQREAPHLGTPCVTPRPNTEWVETVRTGWTTLVDADADRIETELSGQSPSPGQTRPYGDGKAGVEIRETIEEIV